MNKHSFSTLLFAAALAVAAALLAPVAAVAQEEFERVVTGTVPQVKIGQLKLSCASLPLHAESLSEQSGAVISASGVIAPGGNPFRYGTLKILDRRVCQGGDADFAPLLWAAYANPPSGNGNVVVARIQGGHNVDTGEDLAFVFLDDGGLQLRQLKDAENLRVMDVFNRTFYDGAGVRAIDFSDGVTLRGNIRLAGPILTGTIPGQRIAPFSGTALPVSGTAGMIFFNTATATFWARISSSSGTNYWKQITLQP